MNDIPSSHCVGTELIAAPAVQRAPRGADRYELTTCDRAMVHQLVRSLVERYQSVENADFLTEVTVHAQSLPLPMRRFLNAYRLSDGETSATLISGYAPNDGEIGPTPKHWDGRPPVSPTLAEDIYLMLCGALIGDAFGWATQQGGFLVHDILPVKGSEYEQVGASSQGILHWHTEDAFHPYRADHLALFCLRNSSRTATTWGDLDLSLLSSADIDVLFQARYTILADDSHKRDKGGREEHWRGQAQDDLEQAYRAKEAADREPAKVTLLRGHRDDPDLCVDPVYMNLTAGDPDASRALAALIDAIEHNLRELVLSPGDLLILNNAKAVHGRQPFAAGYDGTDRWLKRINLTSNLRNSRDARPHSTHRVIF